MFLLRKPWIFLTPLVVLAAIVMVRLGLWQLDRLEQRRAFNAQVLSQIDQPPLDLRTQPLPEDWRALTFRTLIVSGTFDTAHQAVLGNQAHRGQAGMHLITPLQLESHPEMAILVDRGWIPIEDWQANALAQYDQPGTVVLQGMLAATQERYGIQDCLAEGVDTSLPPEVWCVNPALFDLPYNLAPVYLIQAPTEGESTPPYRQLPHIEINEGPHLSYAIQWFSFAILLLLGYPFFVYREMNARARHAAGE